MMRRIALPLFVGAVLATGACGAGRQVATVADGPAAPRTDAGRNELSFLVGMIPHHAQAVDMAMLGLGRTRDPRVRRLCTAVITTQTREIASMRQWSVSWYATVPSEVVSALHSAEGAAGEGGMLKDEEMGGLATLSGPAFDVEFIRRMTAHHVGAVESAERIRDVAPHAEVRTLSSAMIATQTEEITDMAAWAKTIRTR